MPSRKRKSRQQCEKLNQLDSLTIIRRVLPPPNQVLLLSDFVGRYAPSLKLNADAEMPHSIQEKLSHWVIAPLDTIRSSPHLTSVKCREPVPSIVDDVVWALVQRRDSCKHTVKDGRNVLAQGFSSSPPEDHPNRCAMMGNRSIRPGLTQVETNNNVTYCKSSPLFYHLHRHIGDELFRKILLHTRLFVPLESGTAPNDNHGNYFLVCGPPVNPAPVRQQHLTHTTLETRTIQEEPQERPRRKRRRFHPPVDSHLQANQSIPRFNLFYSDSFTPKVGLHNRHPFHITTMTPKKLLTFMTDLNNKKGCRRRKRWKRLRSSGMEICRKILASGKKCDYHRLMERHCPLPYLGAVRTMDDKNALQVLVQFYSPPEQVAAFVNAVLEKVFPLEFWGSHRNLEVTRSTVEAFILLRRKERLSNKRLMHGIRTCHLKWLQGDNMPEGSLSRTNHEATSRLALLVFRWLFRSFIIPLLRSNFYVTETEFSAKKVLYYRKPVWSAFRALSMRKLLQEQFRELAKANLVNCLLPHRMGFSRLRLVPKLTGVRPIAHLSQPFRLNVEKLLQAQNGSTPRTCHFLPKHAPSAVRPTLLSTNTILAQVFDVLAYESSRHHEPFGSGMSGFSDFYPRYRQYITTLKRQLRRSDSLNLTFASIDIEKCYDNIKQDIMYEIASDQVVNDNYMIQKYSLVYRNNVTGRIQRVVKKILGAPENHRLLPIDGQAITATCNNAVLDSHATRVIHKETIRDLLHEHLSSNLVVTSGRYDRRYLVQESGISQGSILSMLLCNLYYGRVENLLLKMDNSQTPLGKENDNKQERNCDFLARQVDDFLFISTEKESVVSFLQRMWLGRPELGVELNHEKSLVSEEVTLQLDTEQGSRTVKLPSASDKHGQGKRYFPWCGLLFDVQTGEVVVDYQRFQGSSPKDSLTVDNFGCEGWKLAARMESFARPRCVPILYDNEINRQSTIVKNYYEMMMFAAVKTVEYLQSTHVNPTVAQNQGFLIKCIHSLGAYSGRQIRCNLKTQSPGKDSFIFSDAEISWLTCHAFSFVFSKHDELKALHHSLRSNVSANPFSSSSVENIVKKVARTFILNQSL